MKFKPKGRKIYRKKSKFERIQAFKSNTSAVLGTLLAACVLIFVGYSAGGPLIRFLQESQILAVPNEVEETLPPTEATDASQEDPALAETEPVTEAKPEAPRMRGFFLDASALITQTALETAIKSLPEGTTHVFVPLKAEGGGIYYATSLPDVTKSGAVQAAIRLETIYETVAKSGAEPIAVLDILEDTIYPQAYSDAAYHYEGGEVWQDSAGKPHISPFSDLTLDYMGNLAAEIRSAGFTSIVCDGLTFPDFSEADLARLDTRVSGGARYTAIVNVIERMQTEAPHTAFYAALDADDLLTNHNDGLIAADSMDLTAIIIRVNDFSAGNVSLLDGLTERNAVIYAWDQIPVPDGEISYITNVNTTADAD